MVSWIIPAILGILVIGIFVGIFVKAVKFVFHISLFLLIVGAVIFLATSSSLISGDTSFGDLFSNKEEPDTLMFTEETECILSTCNCKCYPKGQAPEDKNEEAGGNLLCGINCLGEYNITSCEYKGGKCTEIYAD